MATEDISPNSETPEVVRNQVRSTITKTTDSTGKNIILKETLYDDGTTFKEKIVEHVLPSGAQPNLAKSNVENVEAPFVSDQNQRNPSLSENEEEKIGRKSMFLTNDGTVKKKWWLILSSVVVIAVVVGVVVGTTTSKSPTPSPPDNNSVCNYQIDVSFEYECDNLPPNYENNFEPALIDYHEYVSIEENQRLNNVSVTIVDYQPSACIQTPDRQRNLGASNSHRELLRGLRKSNITYNLFAFCFGQCPDQALPSIPTSNRRYLQENKAPFLDGRYLIENNNPFPDILPFLTKFKEIFKNIVNVNVTEAKTNIAETRKIDCASNTDACVGDSGICCGQNNCRCTNVSNSFCQNTNCKVVGNFESDEADCCWYDSCAETDKCYCAYTQCNQTDICCGNDFEFCNNDVCPVSTSPPTNFPTQSPNNFPTSPQEQFVQKGGDIDGEATGDMSGISVSLSSDGQTVAIGASANDGANGIDSGHVRVYGYLDGSWVQRGGDIDGESPGDYSGWSVSLSSDGMTVAIGSPDDDGSSHAGYVRIYRFNDESWVQQGGDIDGESVYDASGYSVSLSSDGMTVAIGARSNDGFNGTSSGHVRVYIFNDEFWVQKGGDIDGEAAYDNSGWHVSLSSDGATVAIGAPNNDGINRVTSGHVRVYRYLEGSWVQKGGDIDGEAASDSSGYSVSLSSDGATVAIGAPYNNGINGALSGHVRVHRYLNGSWVQIGGDIDGESTSDYSGISVSLSSDGMTIAIGAYRNDGSNGAIAGHVRIYRYLDGSWVQRGVDIDGESLGDASGYSVSLSSDGLTVAIGAFLNDGSGSDSGHVRVYEFVGTGQ